MENCCQLILTIDDEQPVRESFRYYLEDCDFRVIEADNGDSGLEQFRTHQPDLVLLDLRMARRSGLEALAEMVREAPETPVIVISGTGIIEDVIAALRLGAWDYMTKPIVDLSILRHAIDRALETRRLRTESRRHQQELERLVGERTAALQTRNQELLQTLEALHNSESRREQLFHEFIGIFNGIPDAITLWSVDETLLWANEASSVLYQQPVEKLLGKQCREICFLCEDPLRDCEVHRSLRSGEVETAIRQAPDDLQWGMKAYPLRDRSGQIVRVVRLASDITERQRLLDESTRASHLAALGEIAAGVAHEVNNPTGYILLQMPLLRDLLLTTQPLLEEHYRQEGDFVAGGVRYSVLREQLIPLVDGIIESAQRIRNIVEELKDFSRPSNPDQFAEVDLNEVVRKAVALLEGPLRNCTERLEVIYDHSLPSVSGNFRRLEQVIINLLQNACYALPSREAGISVHLYRKDDGRHCVLQISDEGCGIAPEHLAQVTDPFFTTRREDGGTGLGLSVTARIVQQHGGTLQFSSAVGQGTTVKIELPLCTTEEDR